jgi:arylsulfatase A-like enzyme
MSYRFLGVFLGVLSLVPDGSLLAAGEAGSRANIVFILADEMGWNQPGFNGGKKELTPHIDQLAGESLKLTQFYTHSVCAPTRTAFLTGRYAFRTWSDWRSEDFGKPSYLKALGLTLAKTEKGEETRRIHALDTNERTVAEALKEAGYYTAIIGKWHCGEWLPEHLPMGQGFMHQYGHYAWGIDYFTKTIEHNAPAKFAVYDWHRNQKPLQEEGYSTDLFAAEAERVIAAQSKEKPFFLYVPFNAVHGPLNVPERYEGMDAREAMLKALDDGVGRILGAIKKHGFTENTLVVFTNDEDPYEKTDVAKEHPKVVRRLAARLAVAGKERPPLGEKPLLMDPPLPYIYGQGENEDPPKWLKELVDAVRAKQSQEWEEGETPWPQAPVGANAGQP